MERKPRRRIAGSILSHKSETQIIASLVKSEMEQEKRRFFTREENEIVDEYLQLRRKKRLSHNTAIRYLAERRKKSESEMKKILDKLILKALSAVNEETDEKLEREEFRRYARFDRPIITR